MVPFAMFRARGISFVLGRLAGCKMLQKAEKAENVWIYF